MTESYAFVVEAIQAILAPAVMVSACGLLLLGLLNRYATIMGRMRALNNERRDLLRRVSPAQEVTPLEAERLASVVRQLGDLLDRVRLLRNAVISLVVAVGCFVLSSLLIGVRVTGPEWLSPVHPLQVFVVGMLAVCVGVVYEGVDVLRAFRTIRMEVGKVP